MRNMIYILAAVCLLATPAMAQSQFDANGRKIAPEEQEPMTLADILPTINQSAVLKSDKYVTARSILGWRVFDADAKAVGEVRDVQVSSGGAVSDVSITFNRLRLNGDVNLGVQSQELKGAEKGYQTAMKGDDLKAAHGELLARTKADAQAPKGVSVGKLIEADVVSEGGEEIGTLREVLFDATGTYADVAFMVVNFGPFKNKAVAVPFGIITIAENRGKPALMISNADLDVVFNFLSKKQ